MCGKDVWACVPCVGLASHRRPPFPRRARGTGGERPPCAPRRRAAVSGQRGGAVRQRAAGGREGASRFRRGWHKHLVVPAAIGQGGSRFRRWQPLQTLAPCCARVPACCAKVPPPALLQGKVGGLPLRWETSTLPSKARWEARAKGGPWTGVTPLLSKEVERRGKGAKGNPSQGKVWL
jgi:hypothetical protein